MIPDRPAESHKSEGANIPHSKYSALPLSKSYPLDQIPNTYSFPAGGITSPGLPLPF